MKISVIILSYNNFEETTSICLNSLAADPDFFDWEVIVVDNASTDNTKAGLYLAQKSYPTVRWIFNESNVGFSAGNNIGITASTGNIVILLNNDTICPQGMISRLAAHFEQHADIAMVGPVTNAAGNEQGIYTTAASVEGKIQEGLHYALSGNCQGMTAYRLDFFCVAIARETLNKVGLLDMNFGRGYYEDFDYSLRVKKMGLKIKVAEDVFIYHRGSASFRNVPDTIRLLQKHNKQLIKNKHGANVLFPHARESNLLILTQYAEMRSKGEEVPMHRIVNRIQRAIHDKPKSWIKRWRYMNKVQKVAQQLKVDNTI